MMDGGGVLSVQHFQSPVAMLRSAPLLLPNNTDFPTLRQLSFFGSTHGRAVGRASGRMSDEF